MAPRRGLAAVASFDTTGNGVSDAVHLDVGQLTVVLNSQQGGGLSQTFMAPTTGLYTLTEDFASQDDANGQINADAGTFSILIDGLQSRLIVLGAFATLAFPDPKGKFRCKVWI